MRAVGWALNCSHKCLFLYIEMLSTKRIKEILGSESPPNNEVEVIRDEMQALVKVIFEQWLLEKKNLKTN